MSDRFRVWAAAWRALSLATATVRFRGGQPSAPVPKVEREQPVFEEALADVAVHDAVDHARGSFRLDPAREDHVDSLAFLNLRIESQQRRQMRRHHERAYVARIEFHPRDTLR